MAKTKACIDNYLNALINNASADKQLQLFEEVSAFAATLLKSNNLWLFLNSPLMRSSEKAAYLKQFSVQFNIDPKVVNLFLLLIKNNRFLLIKGILSEANRRINRLKSISLVEVKSSAPLTDTQKDMLIRQLKKLGFSNVDLTSTVDSSMVFGFKLFTENKVYDLSLNTYINTLLEKIRNN